MLALVETHISGDQLQFVCNKFGFSGEICVEAEGFSGGIWLFWHAEEVSIIPYDNNSYMLLVL